MKTCNTHCLNCASSSATCKSCGGTIDSTVTYQRQGHSYRQCDCNSGYKVAGTSLVALLVMFVNLRMQSA
jgi:hypothetical protein